MFPCIKFLRVTFDTYTKCLFSLEWSMKDLAKQSGQWLLGAFWVQCPQAAWPVLKKWCPCRCPQHGTRPVQVSSIHTRMLHVWFSILVLRSIDPFWKGKIIEMTPYSTKGGPLKFYVNFTIVIKCRITFARRQGPLITRKFSKARSRDRGDSLRVQVHRRATPFKSIPRDSLRAGPLKKTSFSQISRSSICYARHASLDISQNCGTYLSLAGKWVW